MTSVTGAVTEATHRTTGVARSITALEARSQNLESVAERVRLLGQEIEQRERALEKATAHLARASELRQDVADTVQQLDERTTAAQQMLAALEDGRAVEALSQGFDAQDTRVQVVAKEVEQLDTQLREWEGPG